MKRSLRASAAALTLLAIVLASSAAPTASADTTCTRFASTSGSNSNPGRAAAPYRTAQFLVSRLQPGETGCLRTGEFSENVSIGRGGNPGNPIVLTNAPGERATLLGRLSIGDGANDVVVVGLVLNGRNSNGRPSPIVNGDRVTLRENEITNEHTAICVLLGPGFESAPERALDPVVERNRIHDCGRLPATGHDHGIYVEGTTNARIVDNAIYDNADYGIHLYPDGDGSTIAHNVIDGNGRGPHLRRRAGRRRVLERLRLGSQRRRAQRHHQQRPAEQHRVLVGRPRRRGEHRPRKLPLERAARGYRRFGRRLHPP